MMKKHELFIKVEANSALESHVEFLARVSATASERTRKKIDDRIERIREYPLSYPVFHFDGAETEFRYSIVDRYIILYSVNEAAREVFIELIWDSRMDNAL
jgi:hypothetical protein